MYKVATRLEELQKANFMPLLLLSDFSAYTLAALNNLRTFFAPCVLVLYLPCTLYTCDSRQFI